jgi:uncharacterized protein YprB with RNaseH-like and TPR domain
VTTWDLESTDLAGNFGRILCGSFVDLDSDVVETYRRDKRPWKDKEPASDAKLSVAIRDRLERADVLVGWNSILFDQPLLNARLLAANERPLRVGEKYGTHHLDLMYYARGQSMRIGSSRLDSVAKFFHSTNQKTPLLPEVWAKAIEGDKESWALIVEHCEYDVLTTRDVYHKLVPLVKKLQFNLSEVHSFIGEIPSRRER